MESWFPGYQGGTGETHPDGLHRAEFVAPRVKLTRDGQVLSSLVWNYMLQPSARPQGVPVGPQSTCHAPDRGACALRIPQLLGLMDENTVLSDLYWKPYSLPAGGKQAHSRQSDEVEVCILIWMALSTLEEGMLLEVQGGVSRYEERFAASS